MNSNAARRTTPIMTAVFLTSCYGVLSATAGGDAVLLPPAPASGATSGSGLYVLC